MALIYLARATPLYTARTQVLLELQREKAPGDNSPDAYIADYISAIENQLAILKSDSLLRRVAIKHLVALPPPSKEPQGTSQDAAEGTKSTDERLIQDGIGRLQGLWG